MAIHFHKGKFEKKRALVAGFLGWEDISQATFEKVAGIIKDQASFKGPGVVEGSTMYIAKTAQGFMTVVVMDKAWADGKSGVTMFGCYRGKPGKSPKSDLADVMRTVKSKGMQKI